MTIPKWTVLHLTSLYFYLHRVSVMNKENVRDKIYRRDSKKVGTGMDLKRYLLLNSAALF